MKNVTGAQRLWRNEFGTPPSICVKVTGLHGKFQADVTVQDMNKRQSGRP
jgi:hypothetical protein